MKLIEAPEIVWAGSELFIVTGFNQNAIQYHVLEQSGHFLDEQSDAERTLQASYLGRSRAKFLVGTFGVHHQVCIDQGDARNVHDTWIATGVNGPRQLSLADYAINAWLDTIYLSASA